MATIVFSVLVTISFIFLSKLILPAGLSSSGSEMKVSVTLEMYSRNQRSPNFFLTGFVSDNIFTDRPKHDRINMTE